MAKNHDFDLKKDDKCKGGTLENLTQIASIL